MQQPYSIVLKVDPFVKKWLEANFQLRDGIFLLGNSFYYYAVSALLYQSHVKEASYLPVKYGRFVQVRIAITEYDFYHYGWEVSPMQELRFSRLIRNAILNECLTEVAILRANYKIALSTALSIYMIQYNITEDDIKFDTLRKIYNRKYQKKEVAFELYNRNAVSDFGLKNSNINKKTLNIKIQKPNPNQLSLSL